MPIKGRENDFLTISLKGAKKTEYTAKNQLKAKLMELLSEWSLTENLQGIQILDHKKVWVKINFVTIAAAREAEKNFLASSFVSDFDVSVWRRNFQGAVSVFDSHSQLILSSSTPRAYSAEDLSGRGKKLSVGSVKQLLKKKSNHVKETKAKNIKANHVQQNIANLKKLRAWKPDVL